MDGRYGHSSNKTYVSDANHLYVGKSSGTSDYTSRLTFPALSSLAQIGSSRIRIAKLLLYIRRNESGSATTITAGCSSSSKWGAALAATADGAIANSTDGYQTVDLTDLAGAVVDYTSKWYLHISGTTPRTRFDSTGKSQKPYLMVTWERVAATIRGDCDSAELGADAVTFTITPEVEGETHTLTYSLGDAEGTIAEKAGDSVTWTPPIALAAEIPGDDTAAVEISMAAYDAGGKLLRTEVYYQTVTVPASVAPVISGMGVSLVNSLRGYALAGHTMMDVAPVIDMGGAYGASIAGLSAQLTGGQSIVWTSLTESEPGVFTGAAARTGALAEGTVTLTLSVADSRGRTASQSRSYKVFPYSPPAITDFHASRYEPVYDENEEVVGWTPSDLGECVAVTLIAEAASVAPAGTNLNSLAWTITGESADGRTVSASGSDLPLVFNPDIFPGEVGEDEAWSYTAVVTDSAGGTAVQYAVVAPGHANLSLSPDKWGAAVGMIASGTKDNPMFEVAQKYQTRFHGSAFDKHGSELLGCTLITDAEYSGTLASGVDTFITICNAGDGSAQPGLYLVNVSATWLKSSGSGRLYAGIRSNGVYYAESHIETSDATYPSHNICIAVPLAEGKKIELILTQYSGADLKLNRCRYQVTRIGG